MLLGAVAFHQPSEPREHAFAIFEDEFGDR